MIELTRKGDDLYIYHADPRVTFSGELITSIIDAPTDQVFIEPSGHNGITGSTLTIKAANRTVTYQLTEWLPSIRAYIGEWPE